MSAIHPLTDYAERARMERQRAEGLLAQANADYEAARFAARDAISDGFDGRRERDALIAARLRIEAAAMNLQQAKRAEQRAHVAICHCNSLRLGR